MIELKKQFSKKGTKFNQIFKDNELAIYELSRENVDGNGSYSWYEVFKLIVKDADKFHNDQYEKYPFDEAFGNWAWSCSNIEHVNKVIKNNFPNHRPYET